MTLNKIQVLDMGNLKETDQIKDDPEWKSVARKIREGLGSVGFMYLTNHGIPEETISNIHSQTKKFFGLDLQTKLKYKKNTDSIVGNKGKHDLDSFSGYEATGGEKLTDNPDVKVELKELYDWVYGTTPPTDAIPEFQEALFELDRQCKKFLKEKLLKLLAMSLELDDVDYFVKRCRYFEDPKNYKGLYVVRALHYPPLQLEDAAIEGATRLGEHSDYGFLTLLFQDDTGGLEVKTVDGEWMDATPIPGSIVLNTGDLTEFWTCGIFPATPHRIRIPKMDQQDQKQNKDRYSVVFFNGPDTETTVTPMDLDKKPCELDRLSKNGKVYSKEPMNAFDYEMGRFAQAYK